ncbi:NUDIX domain-containing protein [Vibrio diazotrophicus]|uniref:NUDIX domain-containing protein n=1 Tax=Vibrio diazotrophicus TaxID=685 RepID=UPI00142D909C|nr:NUDIX domain-containing protein [Vibrio diazotrophicus]NIY94363.1 NUDIX domain-containing protein [Vibrio diazotrophicus]
MKEKHCKDCGALLVEKTCVNEGVVPFCCHCNQYRFPAFNTAISAIILSPDQTKILLIQQYGSKDNILVAGYVALGDNLESTLNREIQEEVGLSVHSTRYMSSEFHSGSNTLMCNYLCAASSEDLSGTNHEIDHAAWFSFDNAVSEIKQGSLAETFLLRAIESLK